MRIFLNFNGFLFIFLILNFSIIFASEFKSKSENGIFIIQVEDILVLKKEKCLNVINNKKEYPSWVLTDFDKLNRSKRYWIKGFNPGYLSENNKEFFKMDYDIKLLFMRFNDVLTFLIQGPEFQSNEDCNMKFLTEKISSFFEFINMIINVKNTGADQVKTRLTIYIKPSWLVYHLIPLRVVERLVYPRINQIFQNFKKAASEQDL
jgi:hypothetical protein